MPALKRNYTGLIVSGVSLLLLMAVGIGLFSQRQAVADQLVAWLYQPTAAVAAIDERAQLSDTGTLYFYASQPSVDAAADFNVNCPQQEKGSAILGCYSEGRIYVYDVDNPELDGIEEVTAAHEMLHAAWVRLSEGERARLSHLLEAEVVRLNDTELNDRLAYYARTEPGERTNELHSILGTEHASLSTELEAHYRRYFDDRSVVVGLHQKYQAVFDAIESQATTLLGEINVLVESLNSRIASYNAAVDAFDKDNASLEARRDRVDRTSNAEVNAFNTELAQLRQRQAQLEREYGRIQADTALYDQKVAAYEQLAVRSSDLLKSLDSTQAIPTVE